MTKKAFDDPVGIFWSLCCPSFFDLRLLMTPSGSFGHCVVRHSKGVIKSRKSKKDEHHNDQKKPTGSSKAVNRRRTDNIVLSVLLRFTAFDDPVGIFWSLCCPSFFDLRLLMTPLVSFGHYVFRPYSIKEANGVIKSRKSKKDGQHNDQKIPKGSSKAVNRRMTDNTMTKRYQRGHQKP
jgi:hypothetical protein